MSRKAFLQSLKVLPLAPRSPNTITLASTKMNRVCTFMNFELLYQVCVNLGYRLGSIISFKWFYVVIPESLIRREKKISQLALLGESRRLVGEILNRTKVWGLFGWSDGGVSDRMCRWVGEDWGCLFWAI